MDIAGIATIIASLGSLLGVIVLWKKSRPEIGKINAETKKVMAEESSKRIDAFKVEVETIRKAYSDMLEDQIKNVVTPMETRIDRLGEWVDRLQRQNDALQKEVDTLKKHRSMLEVAINYIRSLYHWIDNVFPSKEGNPKLPAELEQYFNEPIKKETRK